MLTYEPSPGENFDYAAKELCAMAINSGTNARMEFNGIECIATPQSSPNGVYAAYHAEMERRHEEYKKTPEYAQRQREQAEFNRQAAQAAEEGILPFGVRNQDGWDRTVAANTDGYGACGIRFAARWANYMEREIATGAKLEDVAKRTSHEADKEGITGFMYGCAVSILSQVWEHGEQLRCWHNRHEQIGNEGDRANEAGGVLNPAILTVGG